ncbi:hypothetical protein N7448_006913 [Penicillium atrosanguineum]|uniref:Trafficking protein particle complex subunit 12 n=1 Tax=Penicillium atrosanguineum TaxID=1132637 RepID=A0A9W9L3E7_9EURO|nr:uncharacterized protein N7443_010675 [Penicillium atrosanguineum]KAJ5132755.1 hypothetical protein N7448_006913 [Penicillium atrosanguineum]KAJ5290422.1 hypothetical protein N7443_010675 [Penicillium atrosanguineum]KAJ5308244.1 hypothetical protein N7476_008900 [Penicillium atrosanguineum]
MSPGVSPLAALNTATSPEMTEQAFTSSDISGDSFHELDPLAPDDLPETLGKDLSFLLRHNIFHPLSHIDIPSPLRFDFIVLNPGEPLSASLSVLEKLLVEGRFLIAAHFAGSILTSSLISPTDIRIIFSLFYTRLACLELSGNTALAAQESKALEDLNSAFYFIDSSLDSSEHDEKHEHISRHIVPWPLRVLAVRLQSIGFGDSRRSIAGLYELGMEARREVMKREHDDATRTIWKGRLADLGIRTVNALVEMGDLDAAKRSLESLREPTPDSDIMKLRKGLLLLRIGDVDAAEQVFGNARDSKEAALLQPLLSMSDGRYGDAADEWRSLQEDNSRTDGGLIAQNLAVCLLYTGKLDQARELLESQISANHSFGSLIFNLSTVYELCSDGASQLKGQLAGTIANQPVSGQTNLDRSNTDFKL